MAKKQEIEPIIRCPLCGEWIKDDKYSLIKHMIIKKEIETE